MYNFCYQFNSTTTKHMITELCTRTNTPDIHSVQLTWTLIVLSLYLPLLLWWFLWLLLSLRIHSSFWWQLFVSLSSHKNRCFISPHPCTLTSPTKINSDTRNQLTLYAGIANHPGCFPVSASVLLTTLDLFYTVTLHWLLLVLDGRKSYQPR